MIIRFVLALLVWIFVGVLVAAVATAEVPPDYTLIVGYGMLCAGWTVSYWIRARSATARRWWWVGGSLEVVLAALDRRRRTRRGPHGGEQTPGTVTGHRKQRG